MPNSNINTINGSNANVGIVITGGAVSVPLLNSLLHQIITTISHTSTQKMVFGISGGFGSLLSNPDNAFIELSNQSFWQNLKPDTSPLVTERSLPNRSSDEWLQVFELLKTKSIRSLITIGGNGTACTLASLSHFSEPYLDHIIQIPKTMDGDFVEPLANIGYHTALHNMVEEIKVFRRESSLYGSPYLVKVLGRDVGQLAMNAGVQCRASLVLIPEEFKKEKLKLDTLVKLMVGAVIKKWALSNRFGVIILAEGILDCLDDEGKELLGCRFKGVEERLIIDYARTPFEATLRDLLQESLSAMGVNPLGIGLQVGARNVGYFSRAKDPTTQDLSLATTYAKRAVSLISSKSKVPTVLTPGGHVPLRSLVSDQDEAYQCWVDLDSSAFKNSLSHQSRLKESDLSGEMLTKLASVTNLTPDKFASHFKESTKWLK